MSGEVERAAVSISWSQLSYIPPAPTTCRRAAAKAPTRVLDGVSGHVAPGSLFAVLGPSGSGKTSLLDVLAGRKGSGASGRVLFNGQALSAGRWRQTVAYCMQDDALLPLLTVRETLLYALALQGGAQNHSRDAFTTTNKNSTTAALTTPVLAASSDENTTPTDSSAGTCVERVMDVLHLTKLQHQRVGNPLTRGISGGERRRLAIGVELVGNPRVLLVDEGTSGLDASHALRVVRSLKRLARSGTTVVVTVHQPRANIFRLFDGVLLLHKGKPVYCGAAATAIQYFGRLGCACPQYENPADWMLDILDDTSDDEEFGTEEGVQNGQSSLSPKAAPVAGLDVSTEHEAKVAAGYGVPAAGGGSDTHLGQKPGGDQLSAIFVQSFENRALRDLLASVEGGAQDSDSMFGLLGSDASGGDGRSSSVVARQSSWCGQIITLTQRTGLVTLRDPSIIFIRTGAALAVGGLVGLIFYNQPRDESSAGNRINVILFVMCCFSLFCLPAISRYFEERLTFVRERAAGRYCTSAYYVASMLIEIPLLAIIVAGYGTLAYKLVGLNPSSGRFELFLCIIFLVINVGFSWSQLLAACSSSVSVAIAGFMVVLVYSLLLGGFIVSVSDLGGNARWIVQTSYFWQGYEALMVNEFAGDPLGDERLERMGMSIEHRATNLGALAGMIGVLRTASYVALSLKRYERR